MPIIHHIADQDQWNAASEAGEYAADSLSYEGFIHCSGSREQLVGVANRLFLEHDELLVLDLDTAKLAAPLRYEKAANGQSYPHIYGAINLDAVTDTWTLRKNEAGVFA